MNRERGRFRGESLATRLRREAAAERPAFSAEWHERLVRRLPVDGQTARTAKPTIPEPVAVEPRRRWVVAMLPLAAAVGGAAIVAALMDAGPDRQAGRAGRGARSAVAAAVASVPAGVDGPVGLDGLPMFDEIDAGVRDGVASLAASLLDMPDWTMLADFDARALLDSAVESGNHAAR